MVFPLCIENLSLALKWIQMSLQQLTSHQANTRVHGGLTLTLPFEARCKSRLRASLSNGHEVAILLPRGTVLRGGDALASSDGTQVQVIAAAEAVLFATAPDALTLLKGAYHLGNRHTPVELGANYLAILFDPVLADLLTLLGLNVQPALRAFEPEHGAYGGGHKHGHDDSFEADYALAQASFEHHHGDGVMHSHG
jgi:urease accessory protein